MSSHQPGYGVVDRTYGLRLATTPPDQDGPVWMVNLMRYHERARYADGGASGREADDRYAPLDVLADIGAEVAFAGDVEAQLLGDPPPWERIGIVRYPTRRSFIEMQSRDDFRERHMHKEAGMAATIVMGCTPITLDATALGTLASHSRPWDQVEHPPTTDDGPVMVVHVIRFEGHHAPSSTPDHMERYQDHAAVVAGRHGGRVAGWFAVEGTIVGDGREWHQVRCNSFPSLRAFMAVVQDPERLTAQREHREVAIADTYTMVVRPTIDRIEDLRDSG